jgi:tetratricopeptide (TPR) repeat protein
MKTLAALLIAVFLASCASTAPMPPAAPLLHDEAFSAPVKPVDSAAALALSPAMREYLRSKRVSQAFAGDRRRQLIDALYHGDLKLEYDAAITRTAAEAFDARSGNCLALVLMTAAFAKELGLTVHYQAVNGEDIWDRNGELYIGIGHVNLVLEDNKPRLGIAFTQRPLIVDFLPARDAIALDTREIDEPTVVAMYLNNRAVESLAQGRLDEAYWWAREAIMTAPKLLSSYVTLGVIYRKRERPEWSEAVLRRVEEREPDNLSAMSNRVLALRDLGRNAEAQQLGERLARLDPHPPFSYFKQGQVALREGRFEAARRLFSKEIERAPYHHEFEYWLAVTYMEMNDAERATLHLKRAMDVSTTRKDHDLYAGKLDRLKALRQQ